MPTTTETIHLAKTQAVLPDLEPEVFHLEGATFDPNLFSIKELPERKTCARGVAQAVFARL